MNDSNPTEAEAIRHDIDDTRRRMDETVDALGERFKPRHLLDEVVGFFRRDAEGDGELHHLRQKITQSAETAMNSVVDTVKRNPVPALLIGAGVAWMIYESRRPRDRGAREWSALSEETSETADYDPEIHYDRPLDYPSSSGTSAEASAWSDQGGSELGGGKLREKAQQARDKLNGVRERASDTLHSLRDRAGEIGQQVSERTRAAYTTTREKVASTTRAHPLETGLLCLAVGVIAGLALPTPNAVNRRVGPAADRLRERTREAGSELVEKGKRVATAAMGAAKEEAQAQGLAPDSGHESAPEGDPSGSAANDPTAARPTR